MKKTITLLMVLVMLVGSIFANGVAENTASEGSTASKGTIYGIYKAGDQTWFINEGAAAAKEAKAQGYDFIFVDAKMNPEEELKALDNAVANHAVGVTTCVPDQTMSGAVIDKMKDAGIPVIAACDALEDADGNYLAPSVEINAYKIGQTNGDWIANYAKEHNLVNDPKCALLLMTMDTVSSCVPRAEGEYDNFVKALPGFSKDRIFKADYDGTTDKGNTAASAVLTAHPEITTWLVTGANEEGTIGACRALESANLDKNACVVGLGAYMAKDEFKNPNGSCMKASAYFSSESVGKAEIVVLNKLINGEEVPMVTIVDAVIVTPENYKEVMGKYAE